jgi:hypothetical protein
MLKNCRKDIKGQQKIGDVLKKINKGNDQSSEIKSEVRQVLDYIITEVCNEVEIDNPSKTSRVNFSHREKY